MHDAVLQLSDLGGRAFCGRSALASFKKNGVRAAVLILLAIVCGQSLAQSNQWTWMAGSKLPDQPGVYGTMGKAAPGNTPGARSFAARWTDQDGNLWLFGGVSAGTVMTYYNDFWKFNVATSQWQWMGGSKDQPCQSTTCGTAGVYLWGAKGMPGSRSGAVSWLDKQGRLWLFGGWGLDSNGVLGYLNDLWVYDTSTGIWTWEYGAFTVYCGGGDDCGQVGRYSTPGVADGKSSPGGRFEGAGWTDAAGHFWLFGGWGFDGSWTTDSLNDLWEWVPESGAWRWMGGSSSAGAAGQYGPLGNADLKWAPGSRENPAYWSDSDGNFWLFGGYGLGNAAGSDGGELNDLWKYNPVTNQWAWMGGSQTVGQRAVFGTQGATGAGNTPGGREAASGWSDSAGNSWVFGGLGFNAEGPEALNDLWRFDRATGQWAWMGGSQKGMDPGQYGSPGISAAGNFPGHRAAATDWTDTKGNLWMFGGVSDPQAKSGGELNDMWRFQPAVNSLPATATPAFSPASGTFSSPQSVSLTDATQGATIYFTTDGSTPTASSTVYQKSLQVDSTENVKAIALAPGYSPSAVASATYTISLPTTATPVITPTPSGTYTSSVTVSMNDATKGATIYYTLDGTTPAWGKSTFYSGKPLTISQTTTVRAVAMATGYTQSAVASATYTIQIPTVATPVISPAGGTFNAPVTVSLSDTTKGAHILYSTDGSFAPTRAIPYAGPFLVSQSATVQAIAVLDGYNVSPMATAVYKISAQPAAPVFNPPGGTYTSVQTVQLSDNAKEATIYYTLDGSTPTSKSSQYKAPLTVSRTTTIKAIAVAAGYPNSPVSTAVYTLNLTAAAPSFSPAAGTYQAAQAVTLSTATPNATIYYTTDGSAPTSKSTRYSQTIGVGSLGTTQIRAIAAGPGLADSPVAAAAYNLIGSPTALTGLASQITSSSAVLNGSVNGHGFGSTICFWWGETSQTLNHHTDVQILGGSSAPQAVSAPLTGLKSKQKYYFEVQVWDNSVAVSQGAVQSFMTN